MTVTIGHYLLVSGLLFTIGLLGVILRRNILVIYMCLEIMLSAAALAFVAFAKFNDVLDGQIMVFFLITVAAAEVALGLAIIVAYYRLKQTTHIEDMNSMKF
ncbi:MAG: NADH-quinone oxidoreductase subunit NuoK [Verrucomicrobiota bacterium]|nr:NADH-quinone oxidoreductase subunit NuoK [Verrucomicrobiota bacterium]